MENNNFWSTLIVGLVLLAIAAILGMWLLSTPGMHASAKSSTVAGGGVAMNDKGGSDAPPINPKDINKASTVNCDLTASIVKDAEGTKAKFAWNYTPGTYGFINQDDIGFLPSNTDATAAGDVMSAPLDKPTTFTLQVGSGIATSTCSVLVDPSK